MVRRYVSIVVLLSALGLTAGCADEVTTDSAATSGDGDGDPSGDGDGDGDPGGDGDGDGDPGGDGDGDGDMPDIDVDPDANWTVNWNSPGDDAESGAAVRVAADGSIFVCGSAGPYSGESLSGLVGRFDSMGQETWVNLVAVDGQTFVAAQDLALDPGGDLVIAGFQQAGDTPSSRDAWLARYTADGDEVWSVTIDGPAGSSDQASAVAILPGGDVAVAGYLRGDTGRDLWVGVYGGNDGAEVWRALVDGPSSDTDAASGVAVDPDGNIVVAGYVTAPVTDTDQDMYIAKYDATGMELWSVTLNPLAGRDDGANSVAVDGSGTIFVAGYARATLAAANYDGVLVALDPAGVELWQTSYGTPAGVLDTFYDVAVDGSGNVAVSGVHTPDPLDEPGGLNGIVRVYSAADGALVGADTHDGPVNGSDYIYGVAYAPSGELIATGSVDVSTPQGRQDLWLASYSF